MIRGSERNIVQIKGSKTTVKIEGLYRESNAPVFVTLMNKVLKNINRKRDFVNNV